MTYELFVEREVHAARVKLPGYVRQRIGQAIAALAENPRPPGSLALDMTGLEPPHGISVLRQRIDRWRVIYAVHDDDAWVWVLAVRRRPPYSYEDLPDLIEKLNP